MRISEIVKNYNLYHREWLEKAYHFNSQCDRGSLDRCTICGYGLMIEKHHFVPKDYNGTDDMRNFIYLCPNHHAAVHFLLRPKKAKGDIIKATNLISDTRHKDLLDFYYNRLVPVFGDTLLKVDTDEPE